MTSIEEYLLSPQAVEDVAALLESAEAPSRFNDGPNGLRVLRRPGSRSWAQYRVDAWHCVTVGDPPLPTYRVYFCVDNGCHVVTDLGDSVRDLRLKNGSMIFPTEFVSRIREAQVILAADGDVGVTVSEDSLAMLAYQNLDGWLAEAVRSDIDVDPPPFNLPKAICVVLCAVSRVTGLSRAA